MIITLCTDNPGGMRAVVAGYQRDGLFERFDGRLLVTHRSGSVPARLWLWLRALLQLLALLCSGRVRLVHGHAAMRGSFWRKNLLLALARRFGARTVLHLHGSELKEFVAALGPFGRRLLRHCLRQADAVLVLSEGWASFIRALEPAARVQVLPNYVLLPPAPEVRQGGATLRCLFLGVLGPRKGIYELLEAVARARASLPGIHLVVGGNGEVDQVRERVRQLGLDEAVEVLGWIGPADKARLLAESDLYVLPSHNEGLPVSLLEAMSYGLPVLSTTVGGIPELVRDGQDGLLVRAGDVAAIADALLALGRSPARRAAMGEQGRQRVAAGYSRDVVLPQLNTLYERLLAADRLS